MIDLKAVANGTEWIYQVTNVGGEGCPEFFRFSLPIDPSVDSMHHVARHHATKLVTQTRRDWVFWLVERDHFAERVTVEAQS